MQVPLGQSVDHAAKGQAGSSDYTGMITPSQGATDDKWFDSAANTQKRSQDDGPNLVSEPMMEPGQSDNYQQ